MAYKKRTIKQRGYCPTQNIQEEIELTYVDITTLSDTSPQYKLTQVFCPYVSLKQKKCNIYDDCPIKEANQNNAEEKSDNTIREQLMAFIIQAAEIEKQYQAKRKESKFGYTSSISGKDFQKWRNELSVFIKRNLKSHELYEDAVHLVESYKTKAIMTLNEAVGLIESIIDDEEFFEREENQNNQSKTEKYRVLKTGLSVVSHELLIDIVESDNPADMLSKRFEGLSVRDDEELRDILLELKEKGFIDTMWADDVPYVVTVKNKARTYVAEYDANEKSEVVKMENIKSNDIFIVHGHDDGAKEQVARFIEKLNLKAIILHEQPNSGQTVIEKFAKHSDVGYAIVLYTPCDEGKANAELSYNKRARQNVIFEHGYFVAQLGRSKVCALVRGNIEVPSDLSGVLFIPMDGDWKYKVIDELKAAGYAASKDMI